MEDIKKTTAPKAESAETVAEPESLAKESAAKAVKGKKKAKAQVVSGRVYIQATYNNTVVTFTDANGNALTQYSAGQAGFRGPKKSTPYAAGIIIQKASEKLQAYGLKEVSVFVKGVGGGREAAIRALNANGINVLSIKDVTPIPHNGCRPKKPRRV
ncbi:MAG: 30S ribosomal protein S11 [Candidatus Buchananbacteria bacterium]|nr:30S ribosomal protein S11 [Candidatus Buchananbacteria bacterium]